MNKKKDPDKNKVVISGGSPACLAVLEFDHYLVVTECKGPNNIIQYKVVAHYAAYADARTAKDLLHEKYGGVYKVAVTALIEVGDK